MRRTITAVADQVPVELYVELKKFYAHHAKKRDTGFTDQWLADLDADVTLSTNVFDSPPGRGRDAIGVNVHALDNWFDQRGIQRRHFLCTLVATRDGDGTVRARCYGLLLTTKPSERTIVHSASVVNDVLQYRGDAWLVLFRHIERDDLARNSHGCIAGNFPDYRKAVLMARASVSEQPFGRDEIYSSVEQFYAHQMQILDSGDAAGWAATFSKDGVFSSNGMQKSVTGHDELLAAAEKTVAALSGEGVTRRHLVSMLTIDGTDENEVRARCYVPVVDTRNGAAALHVSTVICDRLVFSADGWLVQERTIHRDDLL